MVVPMLGGFPIFSVVRVLGFIIAVLVLTWTVHYRGGLALSSGNKDLIFNVNLSLFWLFLKALIFITHYWFCSWPFLLDSKKWCSRWWCMCVQVHPVLMVIGLILFNGEGKTIPSHVSSCFVPCNHVDITDLCFVYLDVWFLFIEGSCLSSIGSMNKTWTLLHVSFIVHVWNH